ncbi:HTH-type transcriptional regulator LeuO [Hyphomicrobiales bacterium]|nr:HTH-type transcriptional regulator LeuO [Hyphomicrobiales bacterium]CAH1689592.1 HTH-type transcriptional regulator LeuO [Hyphomicrobiales bacterium]
MSIRRVDLNLFKVFEAVLQTRSVSIASKELGVTASAVSHALSRLRQAVGDELFMYGENGMEPTPRALAIAPVILDGLERFEEAIKTKPFEPSNTARTFRVSATDFGSTIILTPLIERLAKTAPQLELRIFPYSRMDVIRHLDEGRLDLVIGWFSEVPEHMRRNSLLVDREAVVVRRGHPLVGQPIDRDRLFSYPFVVVELSGSGERAAEGFIDERGVWRRVWIDRLLIETTDEDAVAHVAVSLPHYAAVPGILSATDMIATLPERMARRLVEAGTHEILELPYRPLEATAEVIWHQRGDRDQGLQWLLGELIDVMRTK